MQSEGLPHVREETVEAALGQVRDLIATEDGREQSLNTRAGGLTGFSAVIVAVTTALAGEIFRRHTESVWMILAIIAWIAALGFFAVTLVLAVMYVLIPQESSGLGMKTVRKYPTYEVIGQPKAKLQGDTLLGLIDVLALDRDRNSTKATRLRQAYVWLLVGLAALIVSGAMVGLQELTK